MAQTVKVWDPVIRVFHWSLVLGFAAAWLTADEWDRVHEWAGYAVVGLVGLRLLWGVVGPRYARFAQFVRGPRAVTAYLADVAARREKRHLGHNPAGAAMVVALLAGLAGLGATGWMATQEASMAAKWAEEVHEALANLMLVLVGVHVAGVVFTGLRHGENLVRAMITGEKRAAEGTDVA